MCDVNVSNVTDQNDLNERVKAAAFFGTLQAGFTDFHYLRPIWKKTTEKEALIGVGMTGIASGAVLQLSLEEASKVVKDENARVADLININKAARATTVKPSGTTSCVLGTSSGIHAWHSKYYIRRMRIMKNDPLYEYLIKTNPDLVEDDKLRSHDTAVLSIPQSAPEGSIYRTESALELLERVKKFNLEWVRNGHRKGDNTNNVSATISIDKNKTYITNIVHGITSTGNRAFETRVNEWERVGEWMWNNKDTFNGLSVLPYDNGSYVQAPFEECTEERYIELLNKLNDIDLTKVVESGDNTQHTQEAACAGGNCDNQ